MSRQSGRVTGNDPAPLSVESPEVSQAEQRRRTEEHEALAAQIERQYERIERRHRQHLDEVRRYLKATGDPAAAGFLEMDAEDSTAFSADPRWHAWNSDEGWRRCRKWLREQNG